ncbi:thermonuclease family protein [Dyadobacter arcticus]|uniref:Endonuclease YncB(Thermonuclease family) n=1 Tax=Dyadobacter arcticus TaxID=1078754 RepID=A0ABX0USE3_9BACT|nr:thermonuclease family protein [Dyadobacter arcticus]NIJ55883.1 endonuclease YncB(thermonuclease family) [Dyadobacter arcticus]
MKTYSTIFAIIFLWLPITVGSANTPFDLNYQIPVSSVLPDVLRAEVIGIQDGDTIELKFLFSGKKAGHRMGKPLRIRLLHVNCPERGRSFYKVAKQFASQKCFRRIVRIKHAGNFDKYGRLLGEVVLPDGNILNKELVKNGLAVHFKKYSNNIEYSNLEIVARRQRKGMWSQSGIFLGKS